MKHRISILIFLLIVGLANAQKDSIKKYTRKGDTGDDWWYHRFAIAAGFGDCDPNMIFPVPHYISDEIHFGGTSMEPVFSVSYKFWRFLEVGADYASVSAQYFYYPIASDNLTMWSIAGRLVAHLNRPSKYFDHYAGIRYGYYYITDIPQNYQSIEQYSIGAPDKKDYEFQVFYGATLFPFGNFLGINAEIGLGSPFVLEGGLLIRI